jgi:hypothetical protein
MHARGGMGVRGGETRWYLRSTEGTSRRAAFFLGRLESEGLESEVTSESEYSEESNVQEQY